MLFSATQTQKVEDLARLSLKKAPLYVGVDDHKDSATVEGLEQVLFVFELLPALTWCGDETISVYFEGRFSSELGCVAFNGL